VGLSIPRRRKDANPVTIGEDMVPAPRDPVDENELDLVLRQTNLSDQLSNRGLFCQIQGYGLPQAQLRLELWQGGTQSGFNRDHPDVM
jgi:hypothetical protein